MDLEGELIFEDVLLVVLLKICLWASSFLTFQTIVVLTSKNRELYAQRHDLTENVMWWCYVPGNRETVQKMEMCLISNLDRDTNCPDVFNGFI